MRQGIYELSVIGEDGVTFDECEIGGKKYVRAEPGKEYEVKFTIHPDGEGNFPYTCVICILTIDGRQVHNGFYKKIRSGPSSKPCVTQFRGMPINSEDVQAFMFSDVKVATDGIAVHSKNTSKTGQISVTVYEAQRVDRPVNFNRILIKPSASTPISEGKKFWQQPSLATSGGSLKPQAHKFPAHAYEKLRQTPDATVTIHYHATDVLDLLQDLQNKQHAPPAPIPPPVHFDFSAEPEAVPVVPVPAVVVDLRQDAETAGVAVKVEKIQKKRKLGRSSSDQRSVEVVDLTL